MVIQKYLIIRAMRRKPKGLVRLARVVRFSAGRVESKVRVVGVVRGDSAPAESKLAAGAGDETATSMPVRGGNDDMQTDEE